MKLNKLFATVTACFCMFGSVSYSVERIPTVSLNTVATDADVAVDKWDGTVDTSWFDESLNEYHLRTAEELAGLSDLVNKKQVTFKNVNIYLENDIDLDGHFWYPIGSLAHGNKNSTFFEGAFEGKGHSIYNMKTPGSFCSGLFGYSKGTISSVNIVNCSVSSSYQEIMENYKDYDFAYAGGVCAYSEGRIGYCSVTGNVGIGTNGCNKNEIKAYAGGICGYCSDSIKNCKNVARIGIGELNRNYRANVYVGGICGRSYRIERCENSGIVSVDICKNDYSHGCIGGIGGYSGYGVTECINKGDISVSAERENTYLYIGGIIGITGALTNQYEGEKLSISVLKCSSSGNILVTGKYPRAYIGGIAGSATINLTNAAAHYILECSNFGNVSYDSTNLKSTYSKADYIGGIAGEAYIKNCYNWGNITGREAGALIPRSKEKRSDCYNAGQVNGGAAPNISSMLSNEDFAHSLGNKYVYVENDLPALSWEIENNIVRPDSFRPIVDDYPDASAIRIATSDDLINFAKRVNNGETSLNAYLSADIELRNNVPFQISMYNGIFDGNGKTISGLKTCTHSETQGLFDTLYTSAIVKNLSIKGSFSSQSTCGGICA
ncbi:MAG: hypothetical protein GXY08_02615, partial [Ruminococcus sp.]|nr:hypothetical protein [Ruminococcus sp.]